MSHALYRRNTLSMPYVVLHKFHCYHLIFAKMLLAAPNLSTLSRTVNRTKPFHNYSFSRKRQLNCKLQRQALRGLVVAHALKERNKQDYGDRVLACIPYLLPLLDATHFGTRVVLLGFNTIAS